MRLNPLSAAASLLLCSSLTAQFASAADVLKTDGIQTCMDDAEIKVEKVNVTYDRTTQKVTFDAAGSSLKVQEVMASLKVTAYGKEVYNNEFDPCDKDTKVEQLCPGMPNPLRGLYVRLQLTQLQYPRAILLPKVIKPSPKNIAT